MNSLKILTIIGARPQIIKAAAISRAIKKVFFGRINEILVHTGQHYDENMSEVFFNELDIPKPKYNLNIGSGDHATQTAKMLVGIAELLTKENPDAILLYGDTNSTLAGALAASKMHIPIVHIEGGLRSFNKIYPEEINRILTDHLSTLIFSPSANGFLNLINEGFKENATPPYSAHNAKIYHCGDIMYDNSLYFAKISENKTDIIKRNDLENTPFVLVTLHRENNTNDPVRLNTFFKTMNKLTIKEQITFIVPLHPRTSKLLQKNLDPTTYAELTNNKLIKIIAPTSFLEIIELEKKSELVITDSGGVQKEAFFFKKPCIILLDETPWVELIESGTAQLVGADPEKIENAFYHFRKNKPTNFQSLYGDGKAAEFICAEIINNIKKQN